MTYYAVFKVDSRYKVEIDAKNLEEAKTKAEYEFSGADFGESTDIDGELIIMEDDAGNFLYEK